MAIDNPSRRMFLKTAMTTAILATAAERIRPLPVGSIADQTYQTYVKITS